jgi:hypothetical protein
MDGVTCRPNAAVSRVPRPVRPATPYAAMSIAAQVPISNDGRGRARVRRVSSSVSVPARSNADDDGTSAIQYRERAK